MLNTKQIGNITEMQCMLAFMQLGYNVLTPYGDCERYDFVADVKGCLYKIQVKHACDSHIDEGYIEFKTANKTTRNGQFVRHSYSEDQIDYFATYYNNQCYLVPVSECATTQKRLRFVPPKNGQVVGINFAKDYELEKVLEELVSR